MNPIKPTYSLVIFCVLLFLFSSCNNESSIDIVISNSTENIVDKDVIPPLPTDVLQAMYEVKAMYFDVVKESGIDWLGSDEAYAIFHSDILVSTYVFEDLDEGERTHFVEGQNCINPINGGGEFIINGELFGDNQAKGWSCLGQGAPAPLEFEIFMFEDDLNFPIVCFGGGVLSGCEDDLIGEYVGNFSNTQLLIDLPNPGDSKLYTETLGSEDVVDVDHMQYAFTFKITRKADKRVRITQAID